MDATTNSPAKAATTTVPLTSVVSYPTRCNRWGDARYRGNCDGQLFRNLVLHYQPRRVADPMAGSGTTRDVVAELNRSRSAPIEYWGGDLRTGFNLLTMDLPSKFDFVWIHPPYWNIIRYSDHADDLSTFDDYRVFHIALHLCLLRCYAALNPGGRLAILIGDVRRRGVYTPIMRDILNWERELGALRSIIIKTQHHCRSDSIAYARMEDVPIQHEYCLVFKRVQQVAVRLPAA
jgi:hypothetical protein